MNTIKTIIFDYGNIIGNDPSNYIYKTISKKFGLSVTKIKKEFFKFIIPIEKNQIPEQTFWKKFAKNLGIDNYKKLKQIWIKEFENHARVDKNIISMLKKLKKQYKLCLLSNNAISYQKASIRKLLKKIFHVIIYSYKIKMRKPEKKIYLYTMKKIKSKPNECLIIDDNEKYLSYPKKLGIETIHLKSFQQLKKELDNKLNDRNRIEEEFINLLKKVKTKSKQRRSFTGMGLVLYESKYLSGIPHFNLRPALHYRKKIKINRTPAVNFFLKISQKNNPFHDGFHFFNEKGILTHISQYFVPPIRKIKPNKSEGVRFCAALLGSFIKGVILTGIVTQNPSKVYYFQKGKINKI